MQWSFCSPGGHWKNRMPVYEPRLVARLDSMGGTSSFRDLPCALSRTEAGPMAADPTMWSCFAALKEPALRKCCRE